jgi:glucokinase
VARGAIGDAPLVVGVDVGGTKTAAAAVDARGGLGAVVSRPTCAGAGPDAVLEAITAVVREVAATDGRPLAAVGIGTAGVVDVDRGVIVSATSTFRDWAGTDVRAQVQFRVASLGAGSRPPLVHVVNDVDAHAAGEAWCGAARGARSALLVAVGTGVGAAIVVDGLPWRGAHHVAGEIGHMPVPGAVLSRCTCGRFGHLEAIGAGPAVHRRYLELGGDATSPDTRDVVARAERGDEIADEVVRGAGSAVGQAIAGVVTVLDPEVVVVSGGMADAGTAWWEALEEAVRDEVIDALADLPVVRAELGAGAPLVGAARGAWRLIEEETV